MRCGGDSQIRRGGAESVVVARPDFRGVIAGLPVFLDIHTVADVN